MPVFLAWSFLLLLPFVRAAHVHHGHSGWGLIWKHGKQGEDLARQRLLKLTAWLLLFWVSRWWRGWAPKRWR